MRGAIGSWGTKMCKTWPCPFHLSTRLFYAPKRVTKYQNGPSSILSVKKGPKTERSQALLQRLVSNKVH